MKTFGFFDKIVLTALAFSAITFQSSCDKDDDDDTEYSLSGNATGAQEVPANSSTATGTISGRYNSASNTLSYSINWNGLSDIVSAAHFHGPALAGSTAGPIHDIMITTNGTNGNATNTIIIHDTTEVHLLAGRIYYNLHTTLYPNGEIRAQVLLND